MSDEESSFVILGSTPTPSMEQYNDGHETSITKENGSSISGNMMQSSTQTIKNFSLLNSSLNSPLLSATNIDNLKNDSLVNSIGNNNNQMTQPMEASTASGGDFAEQFLLGEIPAESLKVRINELCCMITIGEM